MHAHPLQRLTIFETVANRLEIRTVGPNLFMTAHANLRRRHAGRRRLLHRRVTVTAIDAVVPDVMFVTELNWLLALDVLAGVPARAINLSRHPERSEENKDRAEDRGPRQVIGAVTKNLWHRRQNFCAHCSDEFIPRLIGREAIGQATALKSRRRGTCLL